MGFGAHIKSLAGQGKLYMWLIVLIHVLTENVSDEESSLETSSLGSTATSRNDIPNMNSTNTSPV